jgi:hypothetical protein
MSRVRGDRTMYGTAGCTPPFWMRRVARAGPRRARGCDWGYPNREEWLRTLEEYQKDLEQEVADIADLIRRLKEEPSESETESA